MNKTGHIFAKIFTPPEAPDIAQAAIDPAIVGDAAPRPAGLMPGAFWLPALLLALITFTAYFPAIRGEFIWDDEIYAGNPALQQPGGLFKIWTMQSLEEHYYRGFPMVYTTFWLERRLWGLQPMGYHLVNIVIHILNAILVWLILKRMRLRGAWMAAAVFALHPVHVESVAWISERKNVLSGLFYLLALGGYMRFEDGRGRRWYLGSLGLFLAAILSKSVTCTLPVVLLLLRWQRGIRIQIRDLLNLLPFFLLSLGVGLSTLWIEVSPLAPDFHLSLLQRMLLSGRALWFYPMKLAWPVNLAFSYERWALDPRNIVQWFWVLAALGAGACIWHARRRLGRNFLAGVGFYVITISLMLGFASNYTFRYAFAADHYQYLASLGLIAVGVGCVTLLFRRNALAETALGLAVLVFLGIGTWRQAGIYKNADQVWIETLKKNPLSPLAHNNLGGSLSERGKVEEAIEHYRAVLQIMPDALEAHVNMGSLLAGQGKLDEAVTHYRAALRIRPGYAEVHNCLGFALYRQGKLDEAVASYRKALDIKPDFVEALVNLGLALYEQGKLGESIGNYRKALKIRPDLAEAQNNLGLALAGQGKFEEAVAHYREALRLKPDFTMASNNLGIALVSESRLDEAIAHFRKAIEIDPNYFNAKNNLDLALELKRKNAAPGPKTDN